METRALNRGAFKPKKSTGEGRGQGTKDTSLYLEGIFWYLERGARACARARAHTHTHTHTHTLERRRQDQGNKSVNPPQQQGSLPHSSKRKAFPGSELNWLPHAWAETPPATGQKQGQAFVWGSTES